MALEGTTKQVVCVWKQFVPSLIAPQHQNTRTCGIVLDLFEYVQLLTSGKPTAVLTNILAYILAYIPAYIPASHDFPFLLHTYIPTYRPESS